MNIISNNCLGGFVYKEVLEKPYSNPLIWHAFMNPSDYIEFIKDFDKLNFGNIELTKEGEGLKNNFILIIDDKYKIYQHHAWFDKDANVPTIFGPNNNDIKYNKIWEYIVNNFNRRVKRMKQEDTIFILFYDPYNKIKNHQKVVDAIYDKKYKGIIFSNQKINLYSNILQLPVDDSWPKEKYGWHNSFMKTYKDKLKELLTQDK